MTHNIQTAKKHLAAAMGNAKIAKIIIGRNVEEARVLMDEDSFHALQEMALETGAAIATIESNLSQFGRTAFGSKRFAVK